VLEKTVTIRKAVFITTYTNIWWAMQPVRNFQCAPNVKMRGEEEDRHPSASMNRTTLFS
jgi:hypothetical protein